MAQNRNLRRGMQVYGSDNQLIGTVEEVHGNDFDVRGQHIEGSTIARVDNDRIYLRQPSTQWLSGASAFEQTGTTTTTGRAGFAATGGTAAARDYDTREGEIRVPVAEERLHAEKRATELGEVELTKRVVEEQVNIPVDVSREEVRVERVNVADRAVDPNAPEVFREGTIRVPVRGEEVVVEKEAVITGEVVVNKERITEQQTISDTVRKERVEIDENFRRNRQQFEQHFNARQRQAGGATTTRRFEEVEPHYRSGFEYGYDQRFRDRDFDAAEPELRREWETRNRGTGGQSGGQSGWDHLREEIREGFNRARGR